MSLSVTQFGKPLSKEKYAWNEDIKVFSSKESNLVIDFDGTSATFTTGNGCTFNTSNGCTFTTGYNCVIIRKDIFEIIKIPKNTTIMLNKCGIQGFTKIKSTKTIIVDGKTIEITNKGFEILKKSLLAEIMNNSLDNAVYITSPQKEVSPG